MKILITGSKGQLGIECSRVLKEKGHKIIETDVEELDITNIDEVYNFFKENKPDLTINCAAFTAVDKCESETLIAYKVNAIGPKILSQVSNEYNSEIMHISTDYVFDGDIKDFYTEFSKTNPKTVYGETKLQGENFTRMFNPKHYIVRTAWLYGEGNNFVRTMIKLSETNDTLKVVNDQKGTPTSTKELVRVMCSLIEHKNYGTFHGTCSGECTWYEFTKEIFKIKGINTNVVPCTTDEFPRPAKRPANSVLRNYMLEITTGDVVCSWQDALKDYLK